MLELGSGIQLPKLLFAASGSAPAAHRKPLPHLLGCSSLLAAIPSPPFRTPRPPPRPSERITCNTYGAVSIKLKKNLIRVPLLPTKRNTYAVLWHRTQYVCHFCPPVWPSHSAKVQDVSRFCPCCLGIPRGGPAECPSDRCLHVWHSRRAIHVYT